MSNYIDALDFAELLVDAAAGLERGPQSGTLAQRLISALIEAGEDASPHRNFWDVRHALLDLLGAVSLAEWARDLDTGGCAAALRSVAMDHLPEVDYLGLEPCLVSALFDIAARRLRHSGWVETIQDDGRITVTEALAVAIFHSFTATSVSDLWAILDQVHYHQLGDYPIYSQDDAERVLTRAARFAAVYA